jgi:hypothetical protein
MRVKLAHHGFHDDERAREEKELAGIMDPVPAPGAYQCSKCIPD